MSLEEIRSNFDLLDDWEDRYRYVIELGRALPALDEALKTDATKVRGCASQVWLATTSTRTVPTGPVRLDFRGDSDAMIVRGLIAILLALYAGRTAEEILATDADAALAYLDLKEHLTQQRSNGLASMVQRIRADAARALADSSN